MKKLFSFLLTAFMVFPIMTAVVSADETSQIDEYDGSETSIVDVYGATADTNGAKNAIVAAIINGESSVYIDAYNIPRTDVRTIYDEVLDEHPEFYYMETYISYSYSSRTGYVESIYLERNLSEDEVAEIEQKVNEIFSLIDSSMSDLQKALVVHEYIIENTAYAYEDYVNGTLTEQEYSAYGCLVDNLCVCQGYASAYSLIMRRLGVSCEIVSSSAMHHAWNVIEIDGSWYHVDCTWDDPVYNEQGLAYHRYFLKSDAEMQNNLRHYGWESEHSCTSTKYDDFWWDDVKSMIYLYNGKYYYVVRRPFAMYYDLVERDGSNVRTLVSDMRMGEYVGANGQTYGIWIYMTGVSGYLYYYENNQIIEYSIDTGKTTVIYTVANGDSILEAAVLPSGEARIRLESMAEGTYITVRVLPNSTVSGWQQVSGKWYYIKPDGTRAAGWTKISDKWYFFDVQGVMKSGWQQIYGAWYYLGNDGSMRSGWQQISGTWYYFDNSGVMKTYWQKIDSKWYYFGKDGSMRNGWQYIDNQWYYFNNSGSMAKGWTSIDGCWFYFKDDGVMTTYWQKIDGKWYYFGSLGKMKTDWQKISGTWYYFGNSGAMRTGWQLINNKWYCFDSSGKLYVDTYVDGYYVNANGVMV